MSETNEPSQENIPNKERDYVRERLSTNAVFVLVYGDKSTIFPLSLELIEHPQQVV
ncbi:hypothetical protein NIES23_60990 (plasmid) [Trichormus variabilis NIES-23]|uniref:Uncharacterized protein n=1 Tax=Trichormus variabilis NIES-23 TaxID=1973479 RepID=A0A1Z4KW63_ANAVA|nr:hypothetical protein NIES23_60990 [Trichormus variabilis NIES-23]